MFILRPSHLLQRRDDKYKFEYYDNDAIVVKVCERRWSSPRLSQKKIQIEEKDPCQFSYDGCGDVWTPIRKSEKSRAAQFAALSRDPVDP